MSDEPSATQDGGPTFDGVRVGRPAVRALRAAGYESLKDLPAHLSELSALHGVGPKALQLLMEARAPGH